MALNSMEEIFGEMRFQSDPVVLLTLMALIIVGGLGFLVWEEILEKKRFRSFSVSAPD